MNFARPIFRVASAIVVAAFFATSAAAYSDEAVKDAEDFLKRINERFTLGEVTHTDVAQAEYHLLEMKYRAGLISKATYCPRALSVLETRGKGIEEEARVGQRSTRDLTDHKREFYKFKQFCD